MAKVSSLIIGLIIASLVGVVVTLVMSQGAVNYGLTSYDNTTFAAYNQLAAIDNDTKAIKESAEGVSERTGVLDVIGSFFSDGYQALKITARSFDVMDDMSNAATQQAELGAAGDYFRVAIGAMIIVFIFVGVLVSAIVKKDL